MAEGKGRVPVRRLFTGVLSGLVVAAVAIGLARLLHVGSPLAASDLSLPAAAAEAEAADGMTAIPDMRAPNIRLIDQAGRTVTLSQFRGKAVVLTFLDPVCWYQCPLQAQDMRLMLTDLPKEARSRVALVAVAANPVIHSLASVRAFDAEQGLNNLPNWYFLTSDSTHELRQVWSRYFVDVSVPRNGMVDHSQVFYLIGPNGMVRYLSNPTDQASGFVGTAELLAAYTARILGVTPHFPQAATGGNVLTHLPFASGFNAATVPTRPVMLSHTSGWRLAVQGGYEVLLHTDDAGRSWSNVSPPGVTKRGGLTVAYGAGEQAWAVVLPYGYNLVPVVFYTPNAGRTWHLTDLLPSGSLAARVRQPLAAWRNTAYLLTTTNLLAETGGGPWHAVAPAPASIPSATALTASEAGVTVSGMGTTWHWTPHTGWERS